LSYMRIFGSGMLYSTIPSKKLGRKLVKVLVFS
jgi:hypothetical protein